ncbi:hypothetical protein CY35_12G064800 [Sphagnum magellanicum]|nr:hypothetical protein CY35_12G064800 [Sphagnum magellanicum]
MMSLAGKSSCTQATNLVVPESVSLQNGNHVKEASKYRAMGVQSGGLSCFQETGVVMPLMPPQSPTTSGSLRVSKPSASALLQEVNSTDVQNQTITEVLNRSCEVLSREISAATAAEPGQNPASSSPAFPAKKLTRRLSRRKSVRATRRRAMVMCLALGMVRPCVNSVTEDLQLTGGDLPATTSGFAGRSNLISQVSLNADRMSSEPEVSDLPQSGIDQ